MTEPDVSGVFNPPDKNELDDAERAIRSIAEAWWTTRRDRKLITLLTEYDRRGKEIERLTEKYNDMSHVANVVIDSHNRMRGYLTNYAGREGEPPEPRCFCGHSQGAHNPVSCLLCEFNDRTCRKFEADDGETVNEKVMDRMGIGRRVPGKRWW